MNTAVSESFALMLWPPVSPVRSVMDNLVTGEWGRGGGEWHLALSDHRRPASVQGRLGVGGKPPLRSLQWHFAGEGGTWSRGWAILQTRVNLLYPLHGCLTAGPLIGHTVPVLPSDWLMWLTLGSSVIPFTSRRRLSAGRDWGRIPRCPLVTWLATDPGPVPDYWFSHLSRDSDLTSGTWSPPLMLTQTVGVWSPETEIW